MTGVAVEVLAAPVADGRGAGIGVAGGESGVMAFTEAPIVRAVPGTSGAAGGDDLDLDEPVAHEGLHHDGRRGDEVTAQLPHPCLRVRVGVGRVVQVARDTDDVLDGHASRADR